MRRVRLEALKEMSAETAKVIRGGRLVPGLGAAGLVPGDVIEVCAGDRVPADCRVAELKTAILRVEQAALTGESVTVQKSVDGLSSAHCELQSKETMLFSGTGSRVGVLCAL
jgi:P-type E1-E2 ATPase